MVDTPSHPPDLEKAITSSSTDSDDLGHHEGDEHEDSNAEEHHEPDTHMGLDSVPMPPLKQSETGVTSRSARAALTALDSFETSEHNPRNWTTSRKWRVTLTVSVSGFIATCGSSMAVPGIEPAMKEFGQTNHKLGVLVASMYVLGMGLVTSVCRVTDLIQCRPIHLCAHC